MELIITVLSCGWGMRDKAGGWGPEERGQRVQPRGSNPHKTLCSATSNCEHVVPEFSHYAEIWPWCYVTKLRKNCFFTIMSAGDGNCVGVGHEVEGLHTIDV